MTKRQIKAMRKKGMTFQEIGEFLGLSRQRVHQRLHGNRKTGTNKKGQKDMLPGRRLVIECRGCKKDINVFASRSRKFCSWDCYLNTPRARRSVRKEDYSIM